MTEYYISSTESGNSFPIKRLVLSPSSFNFLYTFEDFSGTHTQPIIISTSHVTSKTFFSPALKGLAFLFIGALLRELPPLFLPLPPPIKQTYLLSKFLLSPN
jgi:hypothetical protein